MATLLDSYTNNNTSIEATTNPQGQSFTNTNSMTLDSCSFLLRKLNSPGGNVQATLYAHAGTYGTSSVGTGSVLATSDTIVASTLSTTLTKVDFTFSGANRITLSASTYYVICIEYPGYLGGANRVYFGIDTTTKTASGNATYYSGGTWYADLSQDTDFYVYGVTPVATGSSKFFQLF